MTQTSIEWLENELADKLKSIVLNKDYILMESLFNKAKEMEKKQHSRTWDAALDAYEKRGHVYVRAWEDFDEYYNEKFDNK